MSFQPESSSVAPDWQHDWSPSLPQAQRPAQTDFVVIAGPCVLEGDDAIANRDTAQALKEITARLGIPFYFKSSFDKANRSSLHSYRGPGLSKGLEQLASIKADLGVAILTDIHDAEQAAPTAEVADMLQIPAFLCRQTDILLAAGLTGKPVNIKKGQFLSPHDVVHCANKVKSTGNQHVAITERGNTFGYNNLVVDMRSIPIIQSYALPVIMDATHSVQLPGGQGSVSGGQREFAPVLARAAVAAGCDGLFFETHPSPAEALSDGPNMVPLEQVEQMLVTCLAVRQAIFASKQQRTPAHA
jgi:2-dehydro-3-deoxyphosphooctonate aldolase (KDO 8-P synthase)